MNYDEYIKGIHKVMARLRKDYPGTILENCSSGAMSTTLAELPYFDPDFTGEYPAEAPFTISELEEIYPAASAKKKEDEDFADRAHTATFELQSGRRGYRAIWDHIMRISVADMTRIYDNLDVHFEKWLGESDADPYIPAMIEDIKSETAKTILTVRLKTKEAPKQIFREVYEEVQKGQSLSEACASLGGVFPDFFLSMIGAGESSGMLDMVMNRLSEHYLKENKLNNKIKGAMTYPIVLLVLCFVLVIGMFTFILPQFKGLMGEGEMPALTAALFKFSEFIIAKWYILLIAIFIIVVVIIYVLKIPSTRLKIDKFLHIYSTPF